MAISDTLIQSNDTIKIREVLFEPNVQESRREILDIIQSIYLNKDNYTIEEAIGIIDYYIQEIIKNGDKLIK